MRIYKILILISLIMLYYSKILSQIPFLGADFPTLSNLQWGMTIQEVTKYLGEKKVKSGSSTQGSYIRYEDVLLNNEIDVSLQFSKQDSHFILNSISTFLEKPDIEEYQSIEMYFIKKYGNNYKKEHSLNNNIDIEKKVWLFNNGERFTFAAHTYRGKKILAIEMNYASPKIGCYAPNHQVLIRGMEFPIFSYLYWGITLQDAYKYLKGKKNILETTKTKLSYEDMILNTKVVTTLIFDECDSLMRLYNIKSEIIEPDIKLLKSIEDIMKEHYGEKYETLHESSSALFYTINFSAKVWKLENEVIRINVMSHGDDVKKINLGYEYYKSK